MLVFLLSRPRMYSVYQTKGNQKRAFGIRVVLLVNYANNYLYDFPSNISTELHSLSTNALIYC
jgi:hypothetical protein